MSNNGRHISDSEADIGSLISRVGDAVWDFIGCCSIVLLVLAVLFAILSGIRCD